MQNLLGFSRNRKQSWAFHTLEAKFITRWACGWSLVDHIRVDHMKTLLQIDDQRSMSKPYDAGNCTWSRLQLNVLTLRIRLRRKYISESVSSVRSTFKLNLWKTWSWSLIGPDSDDQIMINNGNYGLSFSYNWRTRGRHEKTDEWSSAAAKIWAFQLWKNERLMFYGKSFTLTDQSLAQAIVSVL